MRSQSNDDVLQLFRKELTADGVLREGDSIGTDDETLLRFLRARKFNLQQAKKMFIECQNWRQSVEGVGIDELYRRMDPFNYPERVDIFKHWPMWFHKTDKKGRPINIQSFKGLNLTQLYKTVRPERHWHAVLVNAESLTREVLPAASCKAGKPISQCLVIIDIHGFYLGSFWQIKDLVRNCFQVSQDYYPETMGQVIIVNAPKTFTWVWAIVKPWLAKETVEKVIILGNNYHDTLLGIAEPESLPATLGGTCRCHLSHAGPWLEGRTGSYLDEEGHLCFDAPAEDRQEDKANEETNVNGELKHGHIEDGVSS